MIAEAVDETMAAIEGRMETKVRKGYQQDHRSSPNMVYAKFVHGETRPVDGIPDPHCHDTFSRFIPLKSSPAETLQSLLFYPKCSD